MAIELIYIFGLFNFMVGYKEFKPITFFKDLKLVKRSAAESLVSFFTLWFFLETTILKNLTSSWWEGLRVLKAQLSSFSSFSVKTGVIMFPNNVSNGCFFVACITILTNSRRRNNMIEEEGGKSDCISISRESMTSTEQAATTMILQIYVNTENLILTDNRTYQVQILVSIVVQARLARSESR